MNVLPNFFDENVGVGRRGMPPPVPPAATDLFFEEAVGTT